MKKSKFQAELQMKYKAPYRQSMCPKEGPNSVVNMEEMDCVDVEIRGAGRGKWHGANSEYLDIRVYLQEKTLPKA